MMALACFTRALDWRERGDWARAIAADYDQALALDPRFADAYCNRGLAVTHRLTGPSVSSSQPLMAGT